MVLSRIYINGVEYRATNARHGAVYINKHDRGSSRPIFANRTAKAPLGAFGYIYYTYLTYRVYRHVIAQGGRPRDYQAYVRVL